MWPVWEDVQLQGQPAETPATLNCWSQTTTNTTTTVTTTATTYNCPTTTNNNNAHHQSSIHINGRCCGMLQHWYAGDTTPRPPINHPPPAPSTNEDLPRQTQCLQVPGRHHDCVSQGGGPGHRYPNLRNDWCTCSRRRTTTQRHRGIRIERIGVGILPFPRPYGSSTLYEVVHTFHYLGGSRQGELSSMSLAQVTTASSGPYWLACTL